MQAKCPQGSAEFNGQEVILRRDGMGIKREHRYPLSEVMSIGWTEPTWATNGLFQLLLKGDNTVPHLTHINTIRFPSSKVNEFRALKDEIQNALSKSGAVLEAPKPSLSASKIEELTKLKNL